MEDFIVELQAKLDEAASKELINDDINNKLQGKLNELKLKAIIDPKSAQAMAQQLSDIINQKITLSNINIDTGQTDKIGEQIGENIGKRVSNSLSRSIQSSLLENKAAIKHVMSDLDKNALGGLVSKFNLTNKSIDPQISKDVNNLTKELNALAKEAVKTDTDSAWENLISKSEKLRSILQSYGQVRVDMSQFDGLKQITDYFKGMTINIPSQNIKEVLSSLNLNGLEILPKKGPIENLKNLNTQLKDLGITFTEGKSNLNGDWESIFSGLGRYDLASETNNIDQYIKLINELLVARDKMNGFGSLQPAKDEAGNVINSWMDNIDNSAKRMRNLNQEQIQLQEQLSLASTADTSNVIQNEQKKQESYERTAQVQRQINANESIVKSGANSLIFNATNNAAKEAAEHFRELLENENAVITVSEKFNESNNLNAFTVNIKRASGEVESLHYALRNIGTVQDSLYAFKNIGAGLNDAGAERQTKAIENAYANFTQKIMEFKSNNNRKLSGLTEPLNNFESSLAGLKKGITTIDDVQNSFRMLKAASAEIDAPLKRQLSTFDSYKNSIDQGKESISGYRAELKGLSNAPKELEQELTKASKLLLQINKTEATEGTTANWSNQAKEFVDLLDKIKNKILVLKKEQANSATTQIFNTADLDKQGKLYIQKVNNTIEKTKSILESKLQKNGYTDIEFKGIEEANGEIKSIIVTATDAVGVFKQLNFERAKLQGTGKKQAQFGLLQTDDVRVFGSISSSIQTVQGNLSSLKTTWENQGVLVGEFKNKVEQLESSLVSIGSKDELNKVKSQILALKQEASTAMQANKIQLNVETGGYESKVETLIAKTKQWTDTNGNARISTDTLSTALDKLTTASNAFANNNTVENQQALIKAESELDIEVKKVTNSVRTMNATLAKDSAVSSLHNQIQKFYNDNGAAHKKWGAQLKQMLSETASGAEVTKERITEIRTAFNGVASAAQQAGKMGKTWFQSLKDATKFLTHWTSPTFITMKAIAEVKQGISSIKQLDTALVDLKKTTTMTASQLEDFYYDSNDVAKQMGVTTEEIINQAAEFSRLGYSSAEAATQMAKYSSWFKTISPGMSIEQAGDTLTSVMKAFKYDVQDVEKIMSMINTVGNNFAVSNADISEILTRSSSAMMEANNSLADTIAVGTAATEITRDAASVGTALKTKLCLYVQKCAYRKYLIAGNA